MSAMRKLDDLETERLLKKWKVPTPAQFLAKNPREAAGYAKTIGFPVALKVSSPDIVHKTEAGGVRLNLGDEKAVRNAYSEILTRVLESVPTATISGMLVSRMMPSPVEVIAGIHQDATFGPLVLFGLGGIWVEVFGEAAMRPAPLLPEDVQEMVDSLRGARLLRGARKLPPVRPETIQSLLLTLSDVAVAAHEQLTGIDINPLVPDSAGNLVALDASLYIA